MINQTLATGASSLRFRTYPSRQKQNKYKRLIFLLSLLIIISISVMRINMPVRSEQLIFEPVVVQDGDTLWGLAENTGINMDTRKLVQKIMIYNSLASSTIVPGQIIYLPGSL